MLGHARVRAYAKLNLCLEVLNKRADGFHDLRTIFQTISLHDTISIEVRRARSLRVELESDVEIPGENLILRAAHAVFQATGSVAEVRFSLKKRIPMGGGLGGGSSDAAAVLRALPRMLGKSLGIEVLHTLASALGSDVPFFLLGGTAVGLGRGTELYPLPDLPVSRGLLLLPDVHVSTAEAYGSLGRTTDAITASQEATATARVAMAIASGRDWSLDAVNDFEPAVFSKHALLADLRRQLEEAGAKPARMTGSGSGLFGIFASREHRSEARKVFANVTALPFRSVSRRLYLADEA